MGSQETTFKDSNPPIRWVHMTSPSHQELDIQLRTLNISLPPIGEGHTRAAFDRYPHFFYLRLFKLNPTGLETDELEIAAVHFVVTPQVMLSWSSDFTAAQDFEETRKKLLLHPQLIQSSNHLAFYVADDLLEMAFPFFDYFNDKVAHIEHETLHDNHDTQIKEEIFRLKRIIMRVRRILGSERDVAYQLARYWSGEPSMDTIYAFELYDHVIRLSDSADTYREMMDTVLDIYLSSVSNRLNEIVKTLTIVTALFMPASVIAALYGMNFDHIPGAGNPWGFHLVIGSVVLISIILLWIFKRRKWI
ncbi:magnesium transporter CorA family protein [Sulfobacillus thermosulfidooxidans]|uniref:magnesium transporter CorA family protein n=1 Tax=Sulfobacillus thermosulfidooxidans TaxID=28034 RepID=UPI00041F173F|nr:magnesium transporter CorA family protein [Sulfobacillus thermosulfidooxidans]